MSRAKQARDWLRTQDGPRTSAQIAAGIGGERIRVQWGVGVMLRDGMIARVYMGKPATYVIVRDALQTRQRSEIAKAASGKWLARTAEARAEACKESRRLRNAAKQVIADERNAVRLKAAAAAKAAKDAVKLTNKRPRIIKPKAPKPQQVAKPAQSVDDWLKQGNKIQRLDVGASSGSCAIW